jgi:hypothetical protein
LLRLSLSLRCPPADARQTSGLYALRAPAALWGRKRKLAEGDATLQLLQLLASVATTLGPSRFKCAHTTAIDMMKTINAWVLNELSSGRHHAIPRTQSTPSSQNPKSNTKISKKMTAFSLPFAAPTISNTITETKTRVQFSSQRNKTLLNLRPKRKPTKISPISHTFTNFTSHSSDLIHSFNLYPTNRLLHLVNQPKFDQFRIQICKFSPQIAQKLRRSAPNSKFCDLQQLRSCSALVQVIDFW